MAPRNQLAEQFGVSVMTVQAVMAQLASEGFLRVDGTLGTYVADDVIRRPRTLAMVACPGVRESLFAQAMCRAAAGLCVARGFKVTEYSIGEGSRSAAFDQLCDDAVASSFYRSHWPDWREGPDRLAAHDRAWYFPHRHVRRRRIWFWPKSGLPSE